MSDTYTRKRLEDISPPTPDALETLNAITDADITRGIRDDPTTAPLAEADWFEGADLVPPRKIPVSLRLDPDVVEFFKAQGRGYQTRINTVLRRYMDAVRETHGGSPRR